jgi:hypothetical protein
MKQEIGVFFFKRSAGRVLRVVRETRTTAAVLKSLNLIKGKNSGNKKDTMTLTIQINEDKESVEMFFDNEGLDLLKKIINKSWYEPIKLDKDGYDFDP